MVKSLLGGYVLASKVRLKMYESFLKGGKTTR